MKASRVLLFSFIVVFLPVKTLAQASLVPVYHEVYDWLHYQRVLGNVANYNYESLPLTRGQITEILNQIQHAELSSSDQITKTSYLREFSKDSLSKYKDFNFFNGEESSWKRAIKALSNDDEAHVYVWDDESTNVVIDVGLKPTSTIVRDGGADRSSPFYHVLLLRAYGTYLNIAGFHVEQYALTNTNDERTFSYLPFYGRNAKYLKDGTNKEHFEAYAGLHKNSWSVFLGRGTLKQGVGKKNNLVFSREGIPFDWIRLAINTKYLDYTTVTGFLTWDPEFEILQGTNTVSRTSPSRYTVMHQFQLKPANWIRFGYYEMVNYSNREFEITYLNPVTRLALMEFEQDDQDNGFAGFIGSLRPFQGLEIYSEILVDDIRSKLDLLRVNKRDGGDDDFKSTFARIIGATYALKTGQAFTIDYQKVDPSVYAHRFDLNAHSESGIGLGSQIGPNGDELSLNFDQWFSLRSRISVGYSFSRHGLNYFDSNGNFVDAGGNINESYYQDPTTGRLIKETNFLKGDIHKWNTFYTEIVYEPTRGVKFSAELNLRNITQGDRLNDLMILQFGISIGD